MKALALIYTTLSVMSFQANTSLVTPTSATYEILSTNIAACLGGGVAVSVTKSWWLDLNACGFFGKSDAGLSGTLPSQLLYSARSVTSYGVKSGASFLYSVRGDEVLIGPGIPVIYRKTNWPDPGSGYRVEPENRISIGLVADARIRYKNMLLLPSVGFLNGPKHFFWNLAAGYTF